jgi:hypothetical protein
MKYCSECSAENAQDAAVCVLCGSDELLTSEEMKSKGAPLPHDLDTRKFARAATAEDPLSSDRYVAVLAAAKIPSFARPRRAGAVDPLTSAAAPWWEILVPEENLEVATRLLNEEREKIEAEGEENARAAEQEEAETEASAKLET